MLAVKFGKRLKLLRSIRGMTQVDLAEKTGVSTQYVGRIERGISFPSFKTLTAICNALELEPAALFLFSSDHSSDPPENLCSLNLKTPLDWTKYIAGRGLWMTHLTHDQHYWSTGLYQILGYAPSSPIKPDIQVLKSHASRDCRESLIQQISRALQGKIGPGFEFHFTTRKNQKRLGIQHVDYVADANGNPSLILGVILDITESKALERSLIINQNEMENHIMEKTHELSSAITQLKAENSRAEGIQQKPTQSLAYNQKVQEMISEGIIVHDGQTLKIQDANRQTCEMFGYSKDELLNKTIVDISSGEPPYTKETLLELLDLVRSKKVSTIEWQSRRKDGTIFWSEVSLKHERLGPDEKFFASIRNIDQRKSTYRSQMEVQKQHSENILQKQLENVTGSIAHEFSNLLQVIQHSLEGCSNEKHLPKQANIETARKATKRAAALTRKMLSYSGRGKFYPELININQLIEDQKKDLSKLCSSHCRIRFHLDSTTPLIMADRDLILQAIKSLITNSCEAMNSPQGIINVRTGYSFFKARDLLKVNATGNAVEGFYTYIEVEDSGKGMEEGTLYKIFDPFFSTKTIGRGLGMSSVMTATQRHNGAIDVKSAPNRGTVVRVLFPGRTERNNKPGIKEKQREDPQLDLNRPGSILIADDEKLIREVSGDLLSDAGFHVLYAEDGVEAVEVYKNNLDRISCVILDLTMPRMNGLEAYKKLCELDPRVKVIISSGYNPEKNLPDPENRILGYLQKPYTFQTLLKELHRVIEMDLDN